MIVLTEEIASMWVWGQNLKPEKVSNDADTQLIASGLSCIESQFGVRTAARTEIRALELQHAAV